MTTTPNLPGPVPKATTAISGERIKELRRRVERRVAWYETEIERVNNAFDVKWLNEDLDIEKDIIRILDALPVLQAEVDRLQVEVETCDEQWQGWKARAEKAEAELAAARPVIEAARFVMERFINAVVSGGLTEKRAEALYVLHTSLAAFDYRQRTERAPAGHEKAEKAGEKGE